MEEAWRTKNGCWSTKRFVPGRGCVEDQPQQWRIESAAQSCISLAKSAQESRQSADRPSALENGALLRRVPQGPRRCGTQPRSGTRKPLISHPTPEQAPEFRTVYSPGLESPPDFFQPLQLMRRPDQKLPA